MDISDQEGKRVALGRTVWIRVLQPGRLVCRIGDDRTRRIVTSARPDDTGVVPALARPEREPGRFEWD